MRDSISSDEQSQGAATTTSTSEPGRQSSLRSPSMLLPPVPPPTLPLPRASNVLWRPPLLLRCLLSGHHLNARGAGSDGERRVGLRGQRVLATHTRAQDHRVKRIKRAKVSDRATAWTAARVRGNAVTCGGSSAQARLPLRVRPEASFLRLRLLVLTSASAPCLCAPVLRESRLLSACAECVCVPAVWLAALALLARRSCAVWLA